VQKRKRDLSNHRSRLHLFGEQTREQAGAGPRHAGPELAGGDDLLPFRVDLAALDLELADERVEFGVLEGLVDAGPDALLLAADGARAKRRARPSPSGAGRKWQLLGSLPGTHGG
jgi:hypothetical protein